MSVRIESQAEPIPGYTLLERLGGGGFGEVWKAVAPGGLHKAIKFVYGDLEAASDEGQRAEQELKALSRVKSVRHPYILSLERYDIINGQLIIVMELADRNLYDRFRECRGQGLPGIPREELLGYMEETAEALDLMNGQYQLQHLDIKPQNLFLIYNHVKVADFGLVKDLEGMRASVTGGVTPVYAAPETFDGWVSRFCDQYSLAIVYQELLTGQRPFNGNNVRQLILQHLQASPNLTPLPESDREAIGRALAKQPDERFPTCRDLVRMLRGNSQPARSEAPDLAVRAQTPPESGPAESGTDTGLIPSTDVEEEPAVLDGKPEAQCEPASEPQSSLLNSSSQPIHITEGRDPRWICVPQYAPPIKEEKAANESQADDARPVLPVQEDGVLLPALVIGLGRLGLEVLQGLRQNLHEQFESPAAVPHIRMLYLDTDPEAVTRAAEAQQDRALSNSEVYFVKLNRPSHYLRAHAGRTRIDSWFNVKMLYRIPRSLMTTGLRALGRLAFLDNYRSISKRLQQELETARRPANLERAVQQTGLSLRSYQPRVYVVTSLAGGTGSGMFIDLAYVIRRLLKQLGYEKPEVIGLFLLPSVECQPGQTLALANAYAALTELNHFSAPETTFITHYDEREKPVRDPEPPYSRCMVLPLPDEKEESALRELAGMTADLLCRDLTSPLGRTAESLRKEHAAEASSTEGLTCQTFALYRLFWPRQALLHNAARRVCLQLVQRWISKQAAQIREQVQTAVADVWADSELGSEPFLAQLQETATGTLGQSADDFFASLIQPLVETACQGDGLTPAPVRELLGRLDEILGKGDEAVHGRGGTLSEPLQATSEALTARVSGKLAAFVVQLIEEPGFRLAGAEEATRQLIAAVEKDLQQQEQLSQELWTRAGEARSRIASLLEELARPPEARPSKGHAKRLALAVSNLLDLVRIYPKWRYQSLLLQRVIAIYVSLRGHLSDQLREINFCRDRLGHLARTFADQTRERNCGEHSAPGRFLLPDGSRTLEEAVKQTVAGITPDDLHELDGKVQQVIRRQFSALVHVCMTSANLLRSVEVAMQREAENFVGARLPRTTVVDLYLEQQGSDEEIQGDVLSIFDEAAPILSDKRQAGSPQICILASPPGEAGERFRESAQQAVPDHELILIDSAEDMVMYREFPQVPLAGLEQLGPLAYEAYCQVNSVENVTPHSRSDIQEWRAAAERT
jgi:serine/threonine protein kinase